MSPLSTNYIEGNPLFMGVNIRDFHLKTSSPAIDKGLSQMEEIVGTILLFKDRVIKKRNIK